MQHTPTNNQTPHTPTYANTPKYEKQYNSDDDVTSPWARKVLLCLDGGGVRGYTSLLILKKLMEKIKERERFATAFPADGSAAYCWRGVKADGQTAWKQDYRAHHYFDYIFGTSTGGLSAIMLGRLRTTVAEALEQYDIVGREVFAKRRHLTGRGNVYRLYSSKALERVLGQAVKDHDPLKTTGGSTPDLDRRIDFANEDRKTRTAVLAFSVKTGSDLHKGDSRMYRTYSHPSIPQEGKRPIQPFGASHVPVHLIAMGTSAAPRYFSSVNIDGITIRDGALAGANNPVKFAYDEVRSLHKNPPLMIISIGTGKRKAKKRSLMQRLFRRVESVDLFVQQWQRYKEFIINSEVQHLEFDQFIDAENENTDEESRVLYYRFNVQTGLDDVKLADWRGEGGGVTKSKMDAAVTKYVDDPQVEGMLDQCAKALVDRRQERQLTERWENFALDLGYTCPCQKEQRGRSCNTFRGKSRNDLKVHLGEVHGIMSKAPYVQSRSDVRILCDREGHGACLLETEAEYLDHLRTEHQIIDPSITGRNELERMLDTARQDGPLLLKNRTTTFST